jgi:hypothetical protein
MTQERDNATMQFTIVALLIFQFFHLPLLVCLFRVTFKNYIKKLDDDGFFYASPCTVYV